DFQQRRIRVLRSGQRPGGFGDCIDVWFNTSSRGTRNAMLRKRHRFSPLSQGTCLKGAVNLTVMRKSAVASAAPWVPATGELSILSAAAKECQGCDLYAHATQTVFGEGSREARAVLIGEQPGDREDVVGRPFVGPAGRLLDRALEEAGIDRGA